MTYKQLEQWQKEFKIFTDRFDLMSSEWQDIGLDEVFKAGFIAAKKIGDEKIAQTIKIPTYDLHHYAPVRNITAQLRELGIKYEITGIVNGR
jgi:hypothetical protein